MKLKGNICTKVISSGVIAIQILANTFPSFGYSSLRNPEQYFNDFGKAKPSAVAYANKVIQETPDVHVLNLEVELTRGEAIAVLARAFRPQQSLPLEQRIKDKSSLGLNVGQTEVSAELVKEVEKTISEGSGSDMTSGTDVLDTTKTPFDPSWNDEDKAWWFERRLGFYREVEDVYTALMMDHFDQLGIQDGSFKERHEQWTIFLKDVLKIEFNEEGLEKYIEYLLSTDVDVF